jgi:hypothetical protein
VWPQVGRPERQTENWRVEAAGLARHPQSYIPTEPLPGSIQQMHARGIGVAMLLRSQKVAVSQCGIDAGERWTHAMSATITTGANVVS